jgi:AraC-like DNA-binding protein
MGAGDTMEHGRHRSPKLGVVPISSLKLSLDSIDAPGRFEVWRESFHPFNDIVLPSGAEPTFSASAEHWRLGPVLFGITRAPSRTMVRNTALVARSSLDHWFVRVLRSGRMQSTYAGARLDLVPGQLFVGTFAETYAQQWTEGEWVAAILSRDQLAAWGLDLSAIPSPKPTGAGAAIMADFMLSLAERLPETPASMATALGEAFRGMLTACVVHDAAPSQVAPEDDERRKRAMVDFVIRREIASARLNVEHIARLSGISRSKLYRLFEPEGGVAAHVQRLRLERARAALADPANRDLPIVAVAERSGFHCAASFSRAFRRAYGATPGAVRSRTDLGMVRQTAFFERLVRES